MRLSIMVCLFVGLTARNVSSLYLPTNKHYYSRVLHPRVVPRTPTLLIGALPNYVYIYRHSIRLRGKVTVKPTNSQAFYEEMLLTVLFGVIVNSCCNWYRNSHGRNREVHAFFTPYLTLFDRTPNQTINPVKCLA